MFLYRNCFSLKELLQKNRTSLSKIANAFDKYSFACFSTSQSQNVQFFENAADAVKDIADESKILIGGFGLCGVPEHLLNAVVESNVKNLTVVSSNAGADDFGTGVLFQKNQVKRLVSSYFGENAIFEKRYLSGDLELEFVCHGTLAEKLRAGGAGIPAFYTPAAYGTMIHEGGAPLKYDKNGNVVLLSKPKECRSFKGKNHILEDSITGDFSLIKAWKADKAGNLVFRLTANNFNQPMAKASKITIAEVEEIVEIGELKPDEIHVPNVYVDRIFKGKSFVKKMDKVRTRQVGTANKGPSSAAEAIREKIIRRAALEIKDGMFVNLGIGMPVLASNYIPTNITVYLQGANGVLGLGPYPLEEEVDPDLINGGKETATILPGASVFGCDESFAMIRGGHLQLGMLGAMEVSRFGDLANWMVPGKLLKGMGGAMDLVGDTGGLTKIIATTEHTTKSGKSKIVEECSLPLTGKRCVDMIITEKGVFTVDKQKGLTLTELAEGVNLEELKRITDCPFQVSENLETMKQIEVN